MSRRRRLMFTSAEKEELLKSIGQARCAAIMVATLAKIGSDEYKASQELISSVDRLALCLGAEIDHFHTKPHGRAKITS